MDSAPQHFSGSHKSLVLFLLIVIVLLLGIIGYVGMYAKDLEEQIVTPEEAQAIIDQLPDNPEADGLSPQDRARILEGLVPN